MDRIQPKTTMSLAADAKAALVVAHPSHELRVHGWLQKTRPTVFVLTDGGGREKEPGLPATTRVLEQVGAKPGQIYGRLSDLEFYAALLNQDLGLFIGLADELARSLVQEEIDYAVGDSTEGYSSAHDTCRLLMDAAIEIASRKHCRAIRNLDFLVVGSPVDDLKTADPEAIWIDLDDQMFKRKITAARGYSPKLAADMDAALSGQAFEGIRRFMEPKLAGEVDTEVSQSILAEIEISPELKAQAKSGFGGMALDLFRRECLRPVRKDREAPVWVKPFYEIYGEKMVAAGRYQQVIRYHEHIRPVADALRAHATGEQAVPGCVQPGRAFEPTEVNSDT